MLIDWIWALLATLGIALEAIGWGRLFVRGLGFELSAALGLAITAQFYFVLSLTSYGGSAQTHFVLLLGGLAALALTQRRSGARRRIKPPAPTNADLNTALPRRPHLRLARALSPLLWKRLGPWLVLPALWTLLRLTDALLPANAPSALAIHLFAPHRWFETGTQLIDPLHPTTAVASVWDALYYHAIAIVTAVTPTHRHALVRGQMTAQLLHFFCGEVLCTLLCARLIQPLVRAGWPVLSLRRQAGAHAECARQSRRGVASNLAWAASVLFAWIACAQVSATSTLALADWGSAMLVFGALSFFLRQNKSSASCASSRLPGSDYAGWFLWGTAFSANFAEGGSFFSVLFVWVSVVRARTPPGRAGSASFALAMTTLGLIAWLYRNLTQTGQAFFPFLGAGQGHPGWLFATQPIFSFEPHWSAGGKMLLIVGLLALAWLCVRHKFRLNRFDDGRAFTALLLFTLAGEASRFVFGGRHSHLRSQWCCLRSWAWSTR